MAIYNYNLCAPSSYFHRESTRSVKLLYTEFVTIELTYFPNVMSICVTNFILQLDHWNIQNRLFCVVFFFFI